MIAPNEAGFLDPQMLLSDYLAKFVGPTVAQTGRGDAGLHQTEIACRWFDAFLKRPPTLADLSDLAGSDSRLADLMRLIVSHERLPSTGKATAERLLALWRSIVWHGHRPTNGRYTKLPAVKTLRRRKGEMPHGEIPTSAVVDRVLPERSPPRPASPTEATIDTTLEAFLLGCYRLERPLSVKAIECGYLTGIRSFGRFLGRPAKISDLTAPQVNSFIAALDGTRSPTTVSNYSRYLLILWRFAFEVEILPQLPRRIRKVKVPRLIVEGWDSQQVGTLLATIDKLDGSFRKTGIERRLWWRAFILALWFTGLRLGDVLQLKIDGITPLADGTGRLTVVMSKTGDVIHRLLPADAMQAIAACMANNPERKLIFPVWICRRRFHRVAKLLIQSAGLRGTLKWLRRGGASEAERLRAGAGRLHLGHRTAGLFESNYRVDRITQQEITLPPAPDFKPTPRLEYKPAAKGGAQ